MPFSQIACKPVFFRQKYREFVQFFCDEIFNATCVICKEAPGKSNLVITNPCGHFLCVGCACNQIRNWKDEERERRKCPMCRTLLLDHLMAKPVSYSSTKLYESSLYLWIPSSIYIHQNHNQTLISALTKKDLHTAFRSAFLIGAKPEAIHNVLAPQWEDYYKDRVENLKCSQCKLHLPLDKAFVAICGHFVCTLCGAFLPLKPREGALKCSECEEPIENEQTELIFIRPI